MAVGGCGWGQGNKPKQHADTGARLKRKRKSEGLGYAEMGRLSPLGREQFAAKYGGGTKRFNGLLLW
jgi:hypothetical protein